MRVFNYPMFSDLGKVFWCAVAMISTLVSCSSGDGSKQPLYTIERCAYDDILVIEGYTEPVNSMNIHCPRHVEGTIVSIVETGTQVKKGDVICVIEDANVSNSYERWTLDLEAAYAELEKLKISQYLESVLLEAQVQNNEAEALLAEFDSIQMLYMSPAERRIKELQLERAAVERNRLLKKVEATKVIQGIDVMRIEKRIEWIKRCLEEDRKKMESLTMRAPKDGIAVRAKRRPWSDVTWTIGDNVWNGRVVLSLPDFDDMKVMIYVQETEYKRLHVGDSVMYTFDAMPDNCGWGHITKLASVGKERIEGSKVKTFEVEAAIDSLLAPVESGLSARCYIYLKHVPDTIVVPTVSIFDKDSLKVVYVNKGGRYEERAVTLGLSSPKMTIVADGLSEGERIALIQPNR